MGLPTWDIEHAVEHAIAIEDQEETRLYLGPARSADLLEVVVAIRWDRSEVAIHALKMRPKYRPLLLGRK